MPPFDLIVVSGALLASLITNILLVRHHERAVDNLLDRVHTSPKLEIVKPVVSAASPPDEKLYIPEHVGGDEEWNDYRGEPAEEDE